MGRQTSFFLIWRTVMGGRVKDTIKEWLFSLFQAAIILLVLFVFLWPAKIEGQSMLPAVKDGDRVAISRFAGMRRMYDIGDLVVFNVSGYEENMIKRVIAKEGDTLEIKDGAVYVNGTVLDDGIDFTDGEERLTVPEGCVYVMGDNRQKSTDSRHFGAVDEDDIYGKVILRFYPIDSIVIFD